MNENHKTIAIGKDKDPYQVPLTLIQLSRYMGYIIPNSNRELKEIFKLMGLDSASRRLQGNKIEFKTDVRERMQLQIINKALTLELFTSSMFSYFDHPSEVHANCLVSRHQSQEAAADSQHHVVPHNFAQGGVPDVQVDYKTFMVILEVSAKAQPTVEHFKNQLEGALRHARAIRENGYDKPVYCIIIHERSLTHIANRVALKDVLESITSSERIYITVMSIQELSGLGLAMSGTYEDDITKIQSDDLLRALNATVEKGVQGHFHEEFVKCLNDLKPKPFGFMF